MISKRKFNRPISPHLIIYKPQISSLTSIWHRFTGLYIVLLLIFFLIFFKFLPFFYLSFGISIFSLIWIKLTTFVYWSLLLSFFFHLNNGITHLNRSLSWILYAILICLNLYLIYASLF